MTSACDFQFREANEIDYAAHPALPRIRDRKYIPHLFDLDIYQQSPDAETEIRESFTNVLDGTTTAVQVDVVSANAADTAAGTGIRTVGIFGISATAAAGTFTYYLETVTMAGASAVTTARYYKRIIAVIALTWGSGGKAAGAITVSEKGGTSNCYATLQANMNCTVNARFYLATGYSAAIIKFAGNHVATSTASTAVPLTVGSNARLVYQPDGSKADEVVRALTLLPVMQTEPLAYDREIAGDDTKYFTIKHQTLKQDANCDAHYHLKIAVWRTPRLNTNVMQV